MFASSVHAIPTQLMQGQVEMYALQSISIHIVGQVHAFITLYVIPVYQLYVIYTYLCGVFCSIQLRSEVICYSYGDVICNTCALCYMLFLLGCYMQYLCTKIYTIPTGMLYEMNVH